jgi:uncharacterized protein YjbJ (UPF0337 family)/sporulation protein YlmC with PRC-barrel domain
MDKDRVEDSVHQVNGTAKEVVGKVIGDAKTQAEGATEKAAGKVQNAVGGVKDAVRDSRKNERAGQTMKTIISAAVLAMSLCTVALAQQPAPTTGGPAEIFSRLPAGTTVTNFYKQNVYDPSDNKIGDVDDVLIDKEGRVTALIIGVGGFLGMGEKDVAVPFSSVRASEKNNKWYLVLNTTKDALKAAPGFTYDKTKTTWMPAAK